MNSESDIKTDTEIEASLNRHPEVLASSSLQNFSRRVQLLQRWMNARILILFY